MEKNVYKEKYQVILQETDSVLNSVCMEDTAALIQDLLSANKVFTIGVGRVLLVLECFTKRLKHIGIDSYVVGQITEPAAGPGDILLVASSSGQTILPLAIAKKAKSLGVKIAWIGANPDSEMACIADTKVHFSLVESKQPMKSLFEQSLLLYCDTVAMLMMKEKGITENLWKNHANLE